MDDSRFVEAPTPIWRPTDFTGLLGMWTSETELILVVGAIDMIRTVKVTFGRLQPTDIYKWLATSIWIDSAI